ncbi:response regulator [Candidatus Woesearchaeota archaeon]|nr:response regulator [Candidatus Woesearchaeota archaeon]
MNKVMAAVDGLTARLGRAPRILLVDDEEDITEMFERAFAVVGYKAVREKCTNAAGARVLTAREAYDVIVSDFNNKGASGDHEGGMTLYRKLQRERVVPPLYVVISGQDNLTIPREVPFMRKPIGLYDLTHRVTTELRGRLAPVAGYTSQPAEAK